MYSFTIEVSSTASLIIVIIIVVLAIIAIFITLPPYLLRINVDENTISVNAPLFPGIRISKEQVVGIAVVNLKEREDLKPTVRLFGIGLPGCLVGWFKLVNGSKAYLALGKSSSEVVVIRLRDGSLVMLAPKDISKFISVLRDLGWFKS